VHPDVVEVNLETQARALGETAGKGKVTPSKELKIDTMRQIIATVGLSPHSGRYKVYIIGDADRLNEEASNCMLKTLEEPPAHTVLVLIAQDEGLVLPTIASRCLHIPLRPLKGDVVASSLVRVWGADPDEAQLLAALSGGRLGLAVRLLHDREAMARRRDSLQKMSLLNNASVADRIGAASEWAKCFTDARSDLYEMLDTWETWWRDVLMVGASAVELVANTDQLPALKSVASRVPLSTAVEAVALIQRTRQQLNENVNPRLALESLALNLP
jgi:DNA polymerase-3 subunit delta'